MKLNDLPLDALRSIFDGENSFLVIELWKCGDWLLNEKLSKGAVKNMKLIARYIIDSPSRWPRVLKFLRLNSLSIESIESLGSVEMVREELCSLKKGLTRLEYRNLTVNMAIFGATTGIDCRRCRALPLPSNDPSPMQQDEDPNLEFIKLSMIFPKLKELSCGVPTQKLKNDALEDWSRSCGQPHPKSIAALPRTLISLRIPVRSKDASALELKNLKKLETFGVHHPSNVMIPHSVIMQLPKTIVEIDASLSLETHEYLWSDESERKFPNLVLWRIPLDSNADLSKMRWPPLLKSLCLPEFYLGSALPPFSEEVISLHCRSFRGFPRLPTLPSYLTSLNCPELDFAALAQGDFWLPKTLTSLTLFKQREVDFRHFHLLPRGIKSLDVTTFRVNVLPVVPTAEAIAADISHFADLARKSLSKSDRKTWSHIKKLSKSSSDGTFSCRNLQEIKSGHHFGLPLGLTTLLLHIDNLTEVEYFNIAVPPFVTRLALSRVVGPCSH